MNVSINKKAELFHKAIEDIWVAGCGTNKAYSFGLSITVCFILQ